MMIKLFINVCFSPLSEVIPNLGITSALNAEWHARKMNPIEIDKEVKWYCLKCGDTSTYYNNTIFVCSRCHSSENLHSYIPLKEKAKSFLSLLLVWKHKPEILPYNIYPYTKRELKKMRKKYIQQHSLIQNKKTNSKLTVRGK